MQVDSIIDYFTILNNNSETFNLGRTKWVILNSRKKILLEIQIKKKKTLSNFY